jgi:hypothetical protein
MLGNLSRSRIESASRCNIACSLGSTEWLLLETLQRRFSYSCYIHTVTEGSSLAFLDAGHAG